MKFIAEIDIMPHKAILDPQGKAVSSSVKKMGFNTIDQVRIGKHISLEIEADNKDSAYQQVEKACKELLANPIMEGFSIELQEAV